MGKNTCHIIRLPIKSLHISQCPGATQLLIRHCFQAKKPRSEEECDPAPPKGTNRFFSLLFLHFPRPNIAIKNPSRKGTHIVFGDIISISASLCRTQKATIHKYFK